LPYTAILLSTTKDCKTTLQRWKKATFSFQQEEAICAMVIANNAIRLREIQSAVTEDDNIFGNIESVSVSTIDRLLRRNEIRMKQLYNVPFERNSDRVKEIRHQ